jgi:hypothetical protein
MTSQKQGKKRRGEGKGDRSWSRQIINMKWQSVNNMDVEQHFSGPRSIYAVIISEFT